MIFYHTLVGHRPVGGTCLWITFMDAFEGLTETFLEPFEGVRHRTVIISY